MTSINRRNFVWIVPLVLLITFPLWKIPLGAFLEPRGGYDPEFANRKTDEHHFIIDNADILQSDKGQITADIRAEKAFTGKLPNDFALETVDADIYDREGIKTNIKAGNGLYNTDTRKLILSDNVVAIRSKDNYRLYTDLLEYYDETKKVFCPGKTKVLGDGVEIDGGNMSYYIGNRTYNVGGRVHAVIQGFGTP